jgi:MFS transporter, DHA1 family, multidrug resistance protein
VALVLAAWASASADAPRERPEAGAVGRAFADRRFVGGLWLNLLPALLFGLLDVLAPLRLDTGGLGPLAIGAVFVGAGLFETALNPLIGRFSDRHGRLLPTRLALGASAVVATGLAFAERPSVVIVLVCAAAVAFGGFYTPGMALVSDRAEYAGLAQGLGFGIMNSAWAVGNLIGPSVGGALADATRDAVPYLTAGLLCLLTLALTATVRPLRRAASAPGIARVPTPRRADAGGNARR